MAAIERARVQTVLDRIRPVLRTDGADIELVDIRAGDVSVHLTGLCGRCAAAPLTVHEGLSQLLREGIPEFRALRLV